MRRCLLTDTVSLPWHAPGSQRWRQALGALSCGRREGRLTLALVLRKQQAGDILVRLVVGHAHDHAGTRVSEVALKGQPAGEGRPTEHGHEVLSNPDSGLGAQ